MSDNYCYQKFFNLMPTSSIELKVFFYKNKNDFPLLALAVDRCLFDDPALKLTRSIDVTWLDTHIGSESEFKYFVQQLQNIGTLVLVDNRPKCDNPIYIDYSREMLRCYIKAFQNCGFKCFWTSGRL